MMYIQEHKLFTTESYFRNENEENCDWVTNLLEFRQTSPHVFRSFAFDSLKCRWYRLILGP
jgi:hypothetical protein